MKHSLGNLNQNSDLHSEQLQVRVEAKMNSHLTAKLLSAMSDACTVTSLDLSEELIDQTLEHLQEDKESLVQ